MSGYAEWYEANKDTLFWIRHRLLNGLDPKGNDFFEESMHWNKIEKARKRAREATTAVDAVTAAPYFDKQYHLGKWWDRLNEQAKKELLLYTWSNKGDSILYSYDWWLPYFNEVGFISNTDIEKPKKPVTLYRSAELYFSHGMSWTDSIEVARAYLDHNYGLFGERIIFQITVEPDNLLAILDGNIVGYKSGDIVAKGAEYVVNHRKLPERIYTLESEHETDL